MFINLNACANPKNKLMIAQAQFMGNTKYKDSPSKLGMAWCLKPHLAKCHQRVLGCHISHCKRVMGGTFQPQINRTVLVIFPTRHGFIYNAWMFYKSKMGLLRLLNNPYKLSRWKQTKTPKINTKKGLSRESNSLTATHRDRATIVESRRGINVKQCEGNRG